MDEMLYSMVQTGKDIGEDSSPPPFISCFSWRKEIEMDRELSKESPQEYISGVILYQCR